MFGPWALFCKTMVIMTMRDQRGQRCWVLIMMMMMKGTYSFVLFRNPDNFFIIVQCLSIVALEISLRCLHERGEVGGGMGGWSKTQNVSVKHLGYFSKILNTMYSPVYSYPLLFLSTLSPPQLAAGKRTPCDNHDSHMTTVYCNA